MVADRGGVILPRRASTARARGLVLVALVVIALLAQGTAAGADPVPGPAPAPAAPPTADAIFARLRGADQLVTDASVRLLDAHRASVRADAVALDAMAESDAAARAFVLSERSLGRQKVRLRRLTVRAYVSGGSADDEQMDAVLRGKVSDRAGQVVMFDQVVKRQRQRVAQAREVRAAAVRKARRTAGRARRTQDLAINLGQARVAAEENQRAALAHLHDVRTELRRAAFARQPQVPLTMPLLGDPRLTPEDLAAWFHQSQYHSALRTPVVYLAAWYIDEGRREGVRGDIAFAQAVLETGGFTNQDSVFVNNYAGIGHCDTCGGGFPFASPLMGVRAQIQLLKSYALKKPLYVDPLVDRRLRGPAGCCPTWGDLTRKWATDPTYGPQIMLIYTDIMGLALRRHATYLPPD